MIARFARFEPEILLAAMAPQKLKFLPLLLFLFVLSILSLLMFSLSPSNRNIQTQTLSNQYPRLNPGQNFTFIIKVLTFDRLSSLSRCLASLSNAHYDINDRIHLHLYLDHFLQDSFNVSVDFNQKLDLSKKILDFVDSFDWRFGDKLVHYRTANAGLQAQWLESWWPSSDHEFAFVVEDDLEVSPLYYRFLKSVIMTYYYNVSNFNPSVYGASLQRPRFVPGKHGNKMQIDAGTRIFLYQLVGTWGQLLFPKPWKEFRLWYDSHKAKNMKPFLNGMVTTQWYLKLGEKIWTPWFIKFIHSRGYFNIYTNFLHERALSVSHRDAGVNYRTTAGPDSYLLDESSSDINLSELAPLSELKQYDFCFREVLTNRIVNSSQELGSVLQSVHRNNSVILVNLYRIPNALVKNMLCHFENLNIRNYLLIGPASLALFDLARRGHPVIDATHFSEFRNLAKSIAFHDSTAELIKEILVSSYVTRKSLQLGYSTWLLHGSILPRGIDSFFDSFSHTNDVIVGKSARFLFARSSSSTLKFWDEAFAYKAVSVLETLQKASVSHESILFNAIERLLELQKIKFHKLDKPGMDIDVALVNTTTPRKEKFFHWSSKASLGIRMRQLAHLNLWYLDGDLTCAGVVCHP